VSLIPPQSMVALFHHNPWLLPQNPPQKPKEEKLKVSFGDFAPGAHFFNRET